MVIERDSDDKKKAIIIPYHSEELRWEETDHKLHSARDEIAPDPWLDTDTEHESGTVNNSFERAQAFPKSCAEDLPPEVRSDKEKIPDDDDDDDDGEVDENFAPKLDDFPSDEFANPEENFYSFESVAEASDSAEDMDLPEFDEEARQIPWDILPSDIDLNLQRAERKASEISNMLMVRSPQEQNMAINYLTGIFLALPHGATFKAFADMAAKTLSFAELKTIIELRFVWMERQDWWLRRRGLAVTTLRQGQNALSWKLAQRICQARWEFPPDEMIDESWKEEWLYLEWDAEGYWNFLSFIEEKMKHTEAETLHEGLQEQALYSREVESTDAPNWRRQYPNYLDACSGSFFI